MNFEEPKGRGTLQKDLAPVSDSDDSDEDSDEEPSGYITYRLQIKKVYKTLLSEEELIE
jgi:hypothetical protein